MTQPTLETWDQKMRRLARELTILKIERGQLKDPASHAFGRLTTEIRNKRWEIDLFLSEVPDG